MRAVDQPARLVFIGAPGSGKSTVVNRLVASWLDEARASSRASLLPSLVERETLTRSRPRAETTTMEARVREELSDACLSPDGRRALAAVEAQAESFPDAVLPQLPTLATVEVRDAPRDADFHVRVTATYADERELEALVSKARLAFGLSAGPARRARGARASRDREDDASSSSSFPRDARRRSKKTTRAASRGAGDDASDLVGPPRLSAFERARVASVLGCAAVDDTTLAAALRNRDRPYLPARFRDFLGSERRVDFRGPNALASLAAARLWLARAAGSSASRPGCLALETPITIEVPMKPPGKDSGGPRVVLVDTPGLDDTAAELARAATERALSDGAGFATRGFLRVVDAAVVVSDGAPGPNAALERALRRARTLDRMVSDPRGPALALLWPLDRLGVREADAGRYAAESLSAARAGADAFAPRGGEDAGDLSVSHAVSHEAQSPLRAGARPVATDAEHAVSVRTRDRGWMWHVARARARAAGEAEGPIAAGVATWHGAVLSARGDAAALARFVDGLASAAERRRAPQTRRDATRDADDHSTAKDPTARRGEADASRDAAAGGDAEKAHRSSVACAFLSSPSSSAVPFAVASRRERDKDPTREDSPRMLRAGHGFDGDGDGSTVAKRTRATPVPEAARRKSGDSGKARATKKTVRFAPTPLDVRRTSETEFFRRTKEPSFTPRPPCRKRRKPLLDISRNAHRDATSSEVATPRGGAAAKKTPRFGFGW